MHTEREDLEIESAPHRYLRIAVVTETYPPEINGVAGSIARVVEGLRQRRHELQLIRPRQHRDDVAAVHPGFAELLLRVVGDADTPGAALQADPFMVFRVTQIVAQGCLLKFVDGYCGELRATTRVAPT